MDPNLIARASQNHTSEDVIFECLDIMSEQSYEMLSTFLSKFNRTQFDFVFGFSVSMWIHLNHGDQGLKQFCETLAKFGKFVLLEPQPWKCYQTAARRMRKLKEDEFEAMKQMEHKQEHLEPFLLQLCSKAGLVQLCTFGETNWKRKLLLFKSQ